jgi:hypothetical protein
MVAETACDVKYEVGETKGRKGELSEHSCLIGSTVLLMPVRLPLVLSSQQVSSLQRISDVPDERKSS